MKQVPEYNVLLQLNNCAWTDAELAPELEAVRAFYAKGDGANSCNVTFHTVRTAESPVKWYEAKVSTNTGQSTDKLILPSYYDSAFVKQALRWGWKTQIPIDVICVVLPTWQVQTKTTQGACDWGNSNAGMVEAWIAGDRNGGYWVNGVMVMKALQANLAHELSHAFAFYNGLPDKTHTCMNRSLGNYPTTEIFSSIRVTETYLKRKVEYRSLRNQFRRAWSLFI